MNSNAKEYYNSHVEAEWLRLTNPKCAQEFASTLFLVCFLYILWGRLCNGVVV